MIQTFKASNIWIFIPAVFTGVFFSAFLLHEYQLNIDLIERNKSLLRSTVVKTIYQEIEEEFKSLPDDLATMRDEWQAAPLDLFWFKYQEQQFTFLYHDLGVDGSQIVDTLDSYSSNSGQMSGEESSQRRTLVHDVRRALARQDEPALTQALTAFLRHKENFQLSSYEEIVSWLSLFEGSALSWNRAFAQAALFDGWKTSNGRMLSVSDYYFTEHRTLSKEDMGFVRDQVLTLASTFELSSDVFQYRAERLYRPFPVRTFPKEGLWVQDAQWIVFAKTPVDTLIIPSRITERVNSVESTMKHQGLMEEEDSIEVDPLDDWISLKELPVVIEKSSWREGASQLTLYFAVKILFLLVFLMLMVFAIYTFQQRDRRKQALLAMQEGFINLISHELKTPIASIRVMTETLKKRLEKNLEPRDYTDRILGESDRLQVMIENILSINQLNENVSLDVESHSLVRLIDSAIEEFGSAFGKELDITTDIPGGASADVNPILFSLVIRNLLANANKYNVNDSVKVSFQYHQTDHSLVFCDNGVGIPQPQWEEVFEKFKRLESTEKGMGLGLAISRAIIRAFGGELKIIESNDAGTKWKLQFQTI